MSGSQIVNDEQHVNKGDLIAQADDTGASEGDHLHLQIMLNPSQNRQVEPNTLDTANTSRNPEIWLKPTTSTGTVIGRITYAAGTPIGSVCIIGLEKDPALQYNDTHTCSYAITALKSDDIFLENWGTTDVTPGQYEVSAPAPNYYDFGEHIVRSGQTTYIGLYPVWLPRIFNAYDGWNVKIKAFNISDSYTTQTYVTNIFPSGNVQSQQLISISPHGNINLTPTTQWYYSHVLSPSQPAPEVSTHIRTGTYQDVKADNGLVADDINNGDPAYEQIGTSLFLSHLYSQSGNMNSYIYIS